MKLRALISWNLLILIVLGLITIFYLWGIETVPFHPDESTFL